MDGCKKYCKGGSIMNSRMEKYIKSEGVKSEDSIKYLLIESSELSVVMATLDKTMKELEKKKILSANILMDMKAMQKRIEKLLKKPILANEAKIIQEMLDELLKE
jgi:galactitol-specific phosphotransferase system IIB component